MSYVEDSVMDTSSVGLTSYGVLSEEVVELFKIYSGQLGQPKASGPNSVASLPVLWFEPDFSEPMQLGASQDGYDFGSSANNQSKDRIDSPYVRRRLKFTYKGLNTEATQNLLTFWIERFGALQEFYIPSWKQELPVTSVSWGMGSIDIDEATYGWFPKQVPDAIFIGDVNTGRLHLTGIQHSQVGTVHTLSLNRYLTWGSDNVIVGFLYRVRFDSDSVNFEYTSANTANVTVSFIEVVDAIYPDNKQREMADDPLVGITSDGEYAEWILERTLDPETTATYVDSYGDLEEWILERSVDQETAAAAITSDGIYESVSTHQYPPQETATAGITSNGVFTEVAIPTSTPQETAAVGLTSWGTLAIP